jgi:hypothetical protein
LAVALVAVGGVLTAAGPTRAVPPDEFIALVAPGAQAAQAEFGVPASVAIAQSIQESGWGDSDLTVEHNAYFGIKCASSTDHGPIATHCANYPTQECNPAGECWMEDAWFRGYASMTDSFRDHGHFLRNNSRYAAAFDYTNDPDQFIREVHEAGYATDPNYADDIIGYMYEYDLYRYNTGGPLPPEEPQPQPPTARKGVSGAMAATWGEGRLDVFGRGGAGRAYGNYYERGVESWPNWAPLPGSDGLRSRPVTASWGPGRLDVFAVGADRTMKHWWYDRAVDRQWRGPETLGATTFVGTPAVVAFDPGRVDVFGRDTNDNLRHSYLVSGGPVTGAWATIGAGLTGDPAVAQWHAGRWDVFAVDGQQRLRHWWFDRLGENRWRGPEVLGNTTFTGTPAVVSWVAGRLDVFARDTNGNLRHSWAQSGAPAWRTWETWGLGITSDPVAATWMWGRLDVFAVDGQQRLRHWWFDKWGGDTYRHGPEVLGTTTFAGPLGVTSWKPGRLDVFGVDTNHTMRHAYFDRGAGARWSPWEVLGGTFN